ncbi:hypothetical protein CFIO01_05070 [Colletotrichum fioriniae PJ7]|uniref:Uncharacterized protein n=1 Tax=Colletotrichum fioriniae PJ7 TaxID=1445577 RepID=A0A010R9B0_9PEZI|nr:hypothetical protein CFIO01_05070 [Colletotrichum fioriniae PJ7]
MELPQPPFSCNRTSRPVVSRVLRPAAAAAAATGALPKSAIDHFSSSHTQYGDPILGLTHRGTPPLDCLSATAAQLMQVDGRTCKTRLAGGFAFSREAYDVAKAKYPYPTSRIPPAAPEWGFKPLMDLSSQIPHFPWIHQRVVETLLRPSFALRGSHETLQRGGGWSYS